MFVIYTDGSCLNLQYGGWAYSSIDNSIYGSGSVLNTTNNRMELMAVIKAIKAYSGKEDIGIVTDSSYVMMSTRGKYIPSISKDTFQLMNLKEQDLIDKNSKNSDLWKQLITIIDKKNRTVYCKWVKAHSIDKMNNKVDKMAKGMAYEIKESKIERSNENTSKVDIVMLIQKLQVADQATLLKISRLLDTDKNTST